MAQVFAFLSMPIDTPTLSVPPPIPCSLAANAIGVEGACPSALAAVLKETQITNLECAAAPRVFAFVSAPLTLPPSQLGSLERTQLCGLDEDGWGSTYTVEGITKLCEGLTGSALTSLKCAAARSVRFRVSAH